MHALRIVLRATVVWWGLVAWLLLLAETGQAGNENERGSDD